MNRKEFILTGTAAALMPRAFAADKPCAENDWGVVPDGIRVRFMGTGAADWLTARKEVEGGYEFRRWSSVLFDNRVLVDFTHFNYPSVVADKANPASAPRICFYTHSHGDHYEPAAAVKMGFERVYVHETWRAEAAKEMAEAAAKAGVRPPEVKSVKFGEWYEEGGMKFVPLPANHATSRPHEQSCIYLVQKAKTRLLYATDTGGITGTATRFGKIDAHRQVEQVLDTVRALTKSGAYKPPEGQSLYLCHLAKTLHPHQKELDKTLPAPSAKAALENAMDCVAVRMGTDGGKGLSLVGQSAREENRILTFA